MPLGYEAPQNFEEATLPNEFMSIVFDQLSRRFITDHKQQPCNYYRSLRLGWQNTLRFERTQHQ